MIASFFRAYSFFCELHFFHAIVIKNPFLSQKSQMWLPVRFHEECSICGLTVLLTMFLILAIMLVTYGLVVINFECCAYAFAPILIVFMIVCVTFFYGFFFLQTLKINPSCRE